MRKLFYGLFAIAAAFMFQAAVPGSAQASPAGKAAATLTHAHSDIEQVRHHRRYHRHHRYYGHRYWRPRAYHGWGSCRWLKRRAIYTGSSYWWRRYDACRRGW